MKKGVTFAVSALLFLLAFAGICQIARSPWRVGRNEYVLLPIGEWGFGTGHWDGYDLRARQGIGGRVYYYGVVRRVTNSP